MAHFLLVLFLTVVGQFVFNSRMKTAVVDNLEKDWSGHRGGIILGVGEEGETVGFIKDLEP